MISANELRIGNWYDHFGEYKQATHITISEVWESKRQWVIPIPLTPKVLSKIVGFIEIGVTGCFYNQEINIGIDADKEGNLYLYNNGDLEAHPKELKYLHQLQNLIHALEGTELEIKF